MAQEWEDRSSVDRGVAVLEQARQASVTQALVAQEQEDPSSVYPSSDHQAVQQPRVRYLTFARAVVWSSCRKQRASFRHSIRALFFEFGARSGGIIGINERKSEPLAPLECRAKIQSFKKMIGRRKLQRAGVVVQRWLSHSVLTIELKESYLLVHKTIPSAESSRLRREEELPSRIRSIDHYWSTSEAIVLGGAHH